MASFKLLIKPSSNGVKGVLTVSVADIKTFLLLDLKTRKIAELVLTRQGRILINFPVSLSFLLYFASVLRSGVAKKSTQYCRT